jgi:hypothetical protein
LLLSAFCCYLSPRALSGRRRRTMAARGPTMRVTGRFPLNAAPPATHTTCRPRAVHSQRVRRSPAARPTLAGSVPRRTRGRRTGNPRRGAHRWPVESPGGAVPRTRAGGAALGTRSGGRHEPAGLRAAGAPEDRNRPVQDRPSAAVTVQHVRAAHPRHHGGLRARESRPGEGTAGPAPPGTVTDAGGYQPGAAAADPVHVGGRADGDLRDVPRRGPWCRAVPPGSTPAACSRCHRWLASADGPPARHAGCTGAHGTESPRIVPGGKQPARPDADHTALTSHPGLG